MSTPQRTRWHTVSAAAWGVLAAALVVSGLFAYAGADFHGNERALRQLAMSVSALAVGTYVSLRRPRHPLGWLLLVAGTTVAMTFAGSSWIDWLFSHPPTSETLVRVILAFAISGWIVERGVFVVLLPLVVPDGWQSRRRRVVAALAAIAIGATAIAHSHVNTLDRFEGAPPTGTARLAERFLPWGHRAIWLLGVVALVDLIVRTVRTAADERRPQRWLVATMLVLLFPATDGVYGDAFGSPFAGLSDAVETWTVIALPVVVAIGIVRYGLLDIRVVIRRATTYSGLAIIAGAVYAAIVLVFAAITESGVGVGPVVATGAVAVVVVPAYAVVQRSVDRYVFGARGDPYGSVRSLGERLAIAPSGDEALQLAADTVREQLHLPFVAVELAVAGATVTVATSGAAGAEVERFPLHHQGDELGSLVVGWRTERERFRTSERQLLDTFAQQVSVVAHDAALAEALRRSHAMLLETREQERLRIRRDLHDGLGATLASVSLGLGAAADRLDGGDQDLVALLRDLESELGHAVADIRRLVHDLRPPLLDDLGLVDAVREHVLSLGARTGDDAGDDVAFELVAMAPHPSLPPAVELAAYRVTLEAMTNVVRHARASRCWVTIQQLDDDLGITIEDDGVGVDEAAVPGVGMRSMHDRVLELGGTLRLVRREPHGTSVVARFPLTAIALST